MERAWVVTCITTDRVHKVAHAQSAPELECQHVTAGVQVHDQAGGDVHLAGLHAGQRPAAPGHEQIRVRGTYTVKYLHIYNSMYMCIRAEGIKLFLEFHHFACFIQCTYMCRFRKSLYGNSSFTQKSENPLQKVSNLL